MRSEEKREGGRGGRSAWNALDDEAEEEKGGVRLENDDRGGTGVSASSFSFSSFPSDVTDDIVWRWVRLFCGVCVAVPHGRTKGFLFHRTWPVSIDGSTSVGWDGRFFQCLRGPDGEGEEEENEKGGLWYAKGAEELSTPLLTPSLVLLIVCVSVEEEEEANASCSSFKTRVGGTA